MNKKQMNLVRALGELIREHGPLDVLTAFIRACEQWAEEIAEAGKRYKMEKVAYALSSKLYFIVRRGKSFAADAYRYASTPQWVGKHQKWM